MPRILIVDDEPIDREHAARRLMEIDSLDVLQATNGEEALERVASNDPDIVLTDLRMPRMDGIELVEHMRDEHPLIPVILMTSHGSEAIAVQALAAGAASYVPKSDMKNSLRDTVCRVIEVARSRRSRETVLAYMKSCGSHFELDNDPELIVPLVGFLRDSLDKMSFATETTRGHIGMALMEALSNAMIHGNLGISSDLKREDRDAYYALIDRRRHEEPYASRRVVCIAEESADYVGYEIRDEGDGFDFDTLPDPTLPENMAHATGRGILLMRTFMDEVSYNERGNVLKMSMQNLSSSS